MHDPPAGNQVRVRDGAGAEQVVIDTGGEGGGGTGRGPERGTEKVTADEAMMRWYW